ncbi:MAG: ABZJ_00895 family protein [Jannaschia sp.]
MAQTPRTPYLGRYLVAMIGVTIGLTVLRIALIQVAGIALPGGALAIIPPMAGALYAGQAWGRERREVPANAIAWRWALVAGIVYLAVQLLILPLSLTGAQITTSLLTTLAAIIAVTAIVAVFVHRFFLTIGAKGAIARP